MRILSPLLSVNEVQPLCEVGADDFFCGLVDKERTLNSRPNTAEHSFSNKEDLRRAVVLTHAQGRRIFLVINSLPPLDINRGLRQAVIAKEIGIDGLIVASLLLIKKIDDLGLGLELQASSLTTAINSEAVLFAQRLGVSHVHLPTQIGMEELGRMMKYVPGIKFSIFVLGGLCVYAEQFCSLHEGFAEDFIPCQHFRALGMVGRGGMPLAECDKRHNQPAFSCGLCVVRKCLSLGVDTLKIEGRYLPLDKKAQRVSMVRQVIQAAVASKDDNVFIQHCQGIFQKDQGRPCKPEFCIF